MVICDVCKRDPTTGEKNEALKAQPWALAVVPPAGSGLPERRLCWRCWYQVFNAWLGAAGVADVTPPPK
mgnify:FL=1